jgi:hypothetical protein
MYRSLYKERDLTPAPSRLTLRMFGGPLDIEQFREYTARPDDMARRTSCLHRACMSRR